MSSNKQDANLVFGLMRDFFPDFQATREDLVRMSPEFVFNFYTLFVNEYLEKYSFLMNKQFVLETHVSLAKLGPTFALMLQVRKIYENTIDLKITLTDFIRPNPKRMLTVFEAGLHVLIYFNNKIDEMGANIHAVTGKIEKLEGLGMAEQEKLQFLSELSTKIATEQDINAILKLQRDEFNQDLKAKKEVQNLHETENHNKIKQLEILEEQNAKLQGTLDELTIKKKELSECIVTDDEKRTFEGAIARAEEKNAEVLTIRDNYDAGNDVIPEIDQTLDKLMLALNIAIETLPVRDWSEKAKRLAKLKDNIKSGQKENELMGLKLGEKEKVLGDLVEKGRVLEGNMKEMVQDRKRQLEEARDNFEKNQLEQRDRHDQMNQLVEETQSHKLEIEEFEREILIIDALVEKYFSMIEKEYFRVLKKM